MVSPAAVLHRRQGVVFQSMTGFASVEGGDASLAWTWNARSVNGKGLDVRCRVPPGLERLETAARDRAARLMTRGSVSLFLSLDFGDGQQMTVNRGILVHLEELVEERIGPLDSSAFVGLLALPGVIAVPQVTDGVTDSRFDELTAGLGGVLESLATERLKEGANLLGIISGLLDEIDTHIETAHLETLREPDRIRRSLAERLEDLAGSDTRLDEDRLAQEIVLFAARADVREEIDRLRVHSSAARDLLSGGGSPGRRLGFLSQEMLREANTLCSKSSSSALSAAGLDLKVAVDRLREQAQNVE